LHDFTFITTWVSYPFIWFGFALFGHGVLITPLSTVFQLYRGVSLIGGGNFILK
jgi:hypothetical protein